MPNALEKPENVHGQETHTSKLYDYFYGERSTAGSALI